MTSSPDRRGPVLAVCGLAFEARVAAGDGIRTLVGGGRSDALAGAIERAIVEHGIVAIVSFGVAGALTRDLSAGTLIVVGSVAGPDTTYRCDPRWTAALRSRLPNAIDGTLAGSDVVVATTAAKQRLHDETGAIAVDMESHVAAGAAARHALPFAALRAIADPLDRVLPPAALVAMRADGGIDLPAILRSILRRPAQLPTLIAIGRDTRRALGALGNGRRALGRGLRDLDLDQLPVDVV